MTDPRNEQYARLLVETCIDVQPGWQVLVTSGVLGRPLFEAVCKVIAERNAYVLPRILFGDLSVPPVWTNTVSEEILAKPAPLEERAWLECDAVIGIQAPENTRELSAIEPHRFQIWIKGRDRIQERFISGDVPWVGCQYPTPALAQDAGMTLEQFADFLYGSVLLDWEAERRRMARIKELFDAAEEVRIVGRATDVRIGLAGREGKIDAAGANIPGGEVFYSPIEDSAEGEITFSEFPAIYTGRELTGIRLRFERGVVVDAGAATNQEFLLEVLDTDEGARRLGELGIGCNPGITQYMRNTLFDEKINGTVHLALGRGFPDLGGSNISAIHWDIVKDVREGGRIELDGRVVQENGRWLHEAAA